MIAHALMEIEQTPTQREPGRYYIDELSAIVNRKPDTIRKWERMDMLPAHLKPRRGTRDWRYWTDKQVFGPRGILAWMRKNDIRPGAYLTTPEQEKQHIANMRRPRGMKLDMLEEIRYYARSFKSGSKQGQHRRSRKWIIDHYFDQTSYTSKENFEKAITSYFAAQGWEFPPALRARSSSARMTRTQVKQHPEVRRATREANKIIRFVDKKLTTKGK
jgi:hypothetical protein